MEKSKINKLITELDLVPINKQLKPKTMKNGMNKVILIGSLGKDPEVRHLDGGTSVANFSLATSESYKDKNTGERKTLTEWHNIVAWRGLAQVAEKYLKKGNPVYIEGKIRTRVWEDKEGNTRYTTEILADNLLMLGGPGQNETQSSQTSSNETSDDLPFA